MMSKNQVYVVGERGGRKETAGVCLTGRDQMENDVKRQLKAKARFPQASWSHQQPNVISTLSKDITLQRVRGVTYITASIGQEREGLSPRSTSKLLSF